MSKHIIILGEEYWFVDQSYLNNSRKIKHNNLTDAQYLLNYLEKYKNTNINYNIIKHPNELIPTINMIGIENIKGIFLFQDVLSDSYLNGLTILEMKEYLKTLVTKGIYIYPTPDMIDMFASKKYNMLLNDSIPWAALPRTKVYKIDNYNINDEEKIANDLWIIVNNMWVTFDTIVIKKGYSYEGKQVEYFNKKHVKNFNIFKEMISDLNYKNFWGVESSSTEIDKGSTRYYILQGFNSIIDNYEYRVFFNNGEIVYIADDNIVANTCISDGQYDPLKKEIIKFAEKLYNEYIKLFWDQKRHPILFRIDVSYAMDMKFQDKDSIVVDGFDNKIRLYANELEIDPTNFFFNDFNCNTDDFFNSRSSQENLAMHITNYINSIL